MALVPKPRTVLVAGLLAILVVLAFSLTALAEPMVATYYGDEYVGAPTASGEPYDPNDYTAAHPYLPFGTQLLVSLNGASVVVRVNDSCLCGLDLSLAAAQEIGLIDAGVAVVDAEVLGAEAVASPPADAAVVSTEAEPIPPPPADSAILSTEAEPMLPAPVDAMPEAETFQAPDILPTVEDQAGYDVAPEDEAAVMPPVEFAEWPI